MGSDTVTFRGTLARTSLSLSVVPGLEPLERYAWAAHALTDMPSPGIIYVPTRLRLQLSNSAITGA